jgi:Fis family transcriptional regulator
MTTSSNSHEINSLAAGPPPPQRIAARRRARGGRQGPAAHGRRRAVMSKRHIEECIRDSLETYFKDLRGVEPTSMYEMIMNVVEKPLLDVVMKHAEGNQSRAAEWLGINRNTLRRKLVEHKLIK